MNDANPTQVTLEVRRLSAGYGGSPVIRDVRLQVLDKKITAIIGPSGCGKSTLIRCLNRMHEVTPGATMEGDIMLYGRDVLSLDPVLLRRHVGMVFQRPNPFPTMSVFQNVASGLTLNGLRNKAELADKVEASLRRAALWEEVKDNLHGPGVGLSGGQQQRLCIARATARIEELLLELKANLTIVIVTHNMQQAARVSDRTAFMLLGELVEFGETQQLFTRPRDKRTEDYITGRFG